MMEEQQNAPPLGKEGLMMKKAAIVISLLIFASSLVGCSSNEQLRYEECVFTREEFYENWVVESLDGVSAKVKEASPEKLVVELSNSLEHEIVFNGWMRPCVNRDGVWYMVCPKKEIYTPSVGAEEDVITVHSEESREFVCDFHATYQGVSLPAGEYRACIGVKYPSPQANDPSGMKTGQVWIDFTIE